MDVGPHGDELSIRVKDLQAMVFPVTYIDESFIHQQTVGQVEVTRGSFAGLTPGEFEVPVGREAMHPRVAIPVGDIQVTRRIWNQLRGVVEGPSSAGHQVPWPLTARV